MFKVKEIMKIGEVSKMLGINSSAIRFYERHGLLQSSGISRAANGYRIYSSEDVEELKQIVKFKDFGLELKDIKNLLCKDSKSCNDLLTSLEAQLVKHRKMETLIQDRIKLILIAKENCELQCLPENNVKECCS